jgi:glycosyltransferase involved in cell wall biosynthesis
VTSPSASHLVLIPSYNTGAKVLQTARDALRFWAPVWIVVDGSSDGTAESLAALSATEQNLKVLLLARNQGKGAAIAHGLRAALADGFTHVLTMDADGQHPPEKIPQFMAISKANPEAFIVGVPAFGADAPLLRVRGRRISNWWANLETLWLGIGDSLFGLRVYPALPLAEIMQSQRWMRRFDFDPEAAVRLVWRGVQPINVAAPVKYFRPEEGGVSHFHYWRDNALLSWMHLRLMAGFLLRLPLLLRRKLSPPSI